MTSRSKRDHQPGSGLDDPTSLTAKRNRTADEPAANNPTSLDEYTVGWVCALPVEMAAAEGMLERIHPNPPRQNPADHNCYILGEVWGHNVVIACLPSGIYGITTAATVAKDMLRTFQSIRFGLMVGIGGGIPSKKHDIRLGDIVVSQPTDTNGGVIQYDRGRILQQDGFQRTGSLNAPPQALLTALTRLKANHMIKDSRTPGFLKEFISKVPRRMKTEFSHQGVSNDYLFLPDYTHANPEATCDDCNLDKIVKRKEREDTDPFIHYGTIALGNSVIKDANKRDELSKQLGVLCFEMEAAGLQDFPCIVIRGICDYSDSHKNKKWQEYAAATAAAFSKELLSVISPSDVLQGRPIQQLVSIASEHLGVSQEHLELSSQHLVEHRRTNRILEERPIDLHIIHNARYDSADVGESPRCKLNTRVRIQEAIVQWADEGKGEPFLWVVGPAGTGKSTLIRSVADKFHDERRLVAGYFFKRGEQGRNDTNRLFSTLAVQLADTIPSFKVSLRESLGDIDKESMDKKDLKFQFEKLLKDPLERLPPLKTTQPPMIIVLDALDECERPETLPRILKFISELCNNTPGALRLRVLLASRPDPRVTRALKSLVTDRSVRKLQLHRVFPEDTKLDIRAYLQTGFANIKARVNIQQDPWPTVEDVSRLVELAMSPEPLFIYAATLLRFVYDEQQIRDPRNQLKIWLEQSEGNVSQLNQIYNPILEQTLGTTRDANFYQKLQVLGAIVLVSTPLSLRSLASLLGLEVDNINWWLPALHSVLDIPSELDKPIRLLHKSFGDYLLGEENPNQGHFRLNSKEIHNLLADKCIVRMTGRLEQDICGIGKLDATPEDVDIGTLDQCIPIDLRYACLYWIHHLQASGLPPCQRIHTFLVQHFLHWLEALSLLKSVPHGVNALRDLGILIQHSSSIATELVDFVKDANRTISSFGSIVESTPLQIYAALILFSPVKSRIRQQFWDQRLPALSYVEGVDLNWSDHLQTLETQALVRALVFSPDGRFLASTDSSVRLWNPSTGTHLMTFDVGSYPSGGIQFSSNSQILAASYIDQTLRLWDMTTWTQLHIIKCHSDNIKSLVFSPDSQLLASASNDGIVQIWNMGTFSNQQTISTAASCGINWDVAVSPNLQLVAASYGSTVRICSIATGAAQHKLEFEFQYVYGIAFSPDSKALAIACEGKLHIWNTETAKVEYTLEDVDMEPGDAIAPIVFSPDGQLLASSSSRKVRLWNMTTRSYRAIARGHSDWIHAVAFSPDNQLLATSSLAQKIEIYDTAYMDQNPCGHYRERHIVASHDIVFSPDGRFVMSLSLEDALRLWNGITGTLKWSLGNHKILDAQFSPNSKYVAFRSSKSDDQTRGHTLNVNNGEEKQMDTSRMEELSCPVVYSEEDQMAAVCWVGKSIELYHAKTRSHKPMLLGLNSRVRAIAFSPNGQILASSTEDMKVRLWNTNTGAVKFELEPSGTDPATQLVFSPNGEILASRQYKTTIWWNSVTGVQQCIVPLIDGLGPWAISPDLGLLAMTSGFELSGSFKVYLCHIGTVCHTGTDCRRHALHGHEERAEQIVFSPDNQRVAVASDDRTIRLWDTRTYVQLHTFRTYNDIPRTVRFSPDGRIIAAASSDKTIRLWNTVTGQYLQMVQYDTGFLQEMSLVSNKLRVSVSETDFNELWHPWNKLTLKVSACCYLIAHEATTPEPGYCRANLNVDGGWIIKDSKKLVLIPPKYRPMSFSKRMGARSKSWASRGHILFIGCSSGDFIQFRVGHEVPYIVF